MDDISVVLNIICIIVDVKIVGGGDTMNRPEHYDNDTEIDVIDFCNIYKLGFIEGNIIKYIVRYKKKNGTKDLYKAKDYLDRLIEKESNNDDKPVFISLLLMKIF